MRRKFVVIGFLICFLFLSVHSFGFAAQSGKEPVAITVKAGKHAKYVRIVFSAPEEYIQKASVILAENNVIKVDFQSAVVITAVQKTGKVILKTDTPVEMTGGVKIVAKNNNCAFTVDNLDDIDVSKLSSPSRLVIDAYIGKPSSGYPFQEADIAFESFAVDAGHGGYDTGMKGRNFTEKETTLSIAKELANTLGKKGKKVFLTRKGDQTLTIKERIKAVNLRSSEIFISIHVSSRNELSIYTSPKIKGQKGRTEGIQEALEQTAKTSASAEIDKNVADAAAQAIKSEIGINVRHERLPLPIIAHVNAPAVLIELPSPEKFNYDRKNRERLINALLKVIGYSARGKE
ncbi:MAG: N-acetylmuramoyl-L-alanine amidase [Nitrospirae bacterium]|nr:N-acetylmuramoyl-L-alanine amidase [Nitrospirota bacterium]MCL5977958.1 N-acetylmuramoyl-L-alanine amidase [Nitrospirota bacterium]